MSAWGGAARHPLTRVIGLGNDLLSDDGLGVVAVRAVAKRLNDPNISFRELAIGGLELLDHVTECDRCVIIDAIATGVLTPGTVARFSVRPGTDTSPIATSHQIDLRQVLALASVLGAHVPNRVLVYGIEAADCTTFRAGLTPPVERSLASLVTNVCDELSQHNQEPTPDDGRWHILSEQAIH